MTHPVPTGATSGKTLPIVLVVLVALAALAAWWFTARTTPSENTPLGTQPDHSAAGAASTPWFQDRTEASGVDFVHQSAPQPRYWLPEIATGGCGVLDFDNDGWLDLYFVQGGDLAPDADSPPALTNKLYRNLQGFRFEDVTERAGVGDTGYGMGCACGDFDNDGDVDLYVTNVGPNVLYLNNGDGTFTDCTAAAGVGDPSWGTSAAFADADSDGDLDLFVVNYIRWSEQMNIECFSASGERDHCGPNSYRLPAPDTLYRNNGDGTFSDVSQSAGIHTVFGNGLGIACGDFTGDGKLDFYVANDGMPNQLWVNGGDGSFRDEAIPLGCAVNAVGQSEAGMGVQALDLDNDDDLDLFMSHLRQETNTFYRNEGSWFEDVSAAVGLGGPSFEYTGFGLGFADFNHDGHLDLYLANGRVKRASTHENPRDVYAEINLVFRGTDTGRFEEQLPRGGTGKRLVDTSRAAAFGDLDNDGAIDVIVANKDARAYVLRNRAGTNGNWIKLRVLEGARVALDAKVTVESAGRIQRRRVERAYSYQASNSPLVHVGLGTATAVARVTVTWPDGTQQQFGPLASNQLHTLARSP